MNLIRFSIGSPVKVTVGVLFIILFGMIEFYRIPIQLTPDVDKPNITVTTTWPGASPEEVEKEIIYRQEEELKSLEGLERMSSNSGKNTGSIVLEFELGTDVHSALVLVSNKLDQVKGYPDLADRPTITTVDQRGGAMAWFILKTLPQNKKDINQYRRLCEDIIKPAFERVNGVGASNVFGGQDDRVVITFDPIKLSARAIKINDLVNAIQSSNRNFSAGDLDEGKRRYLVRTLGEFKSLKDIENIVVQQIGNSTVFLKDVASVSLGWEESTVNVRHFGGSAIALNCQRAGGSNVLEVVRDLKIVVEILNKETLKELGLYLTQVYDETSYINKALELVQNNIWVGGSLAILVLFFFLRSFTSVIIIAIAIPISIVGTFLCMSILGRNLNVISLAGISFAVGMVVDNSIVVLENIYRHKQLGRSPEDAAEFGTQEVWGAVLSSTLTTMAVFVPVLFMKEEIGQLYRDIALAVSASVFISLIVSVTAIPAMSSRWMNSKIKAETQWVNSLSIGIGNFVYKLIGSFIVKVSIVVSLIGGAIYFSWVLKPPADYLPKGKMNLVIGMLFPPPGNNLSELTNMGKIIEAGLAPHFNDPNSEAKGEIKEPKIKNFFFVTSGKLVFMGAISEESERASELLGPMSAAASKVPGMSPFVTQKGLFERGGTQGRSIKMELTGPELETLLEKAKMLRGKLKKTFPNSQVKRPDLTLGHPEVSIDPNEEYLARAGLTTQELGVAVDVLMDGRKVSEIKIQGREIDIILQGKDIEHVQLIGELPILGRNSQLLSIESIADVNIGTGPDSIPHVERNRVVTIELEPPVEMPLELAMDKINSQIIEPLKKEGQLNEIYRVQLSGSAEDLTKAIDSLKWKFLLAILIIFLLMSALFENFMYPLVIMVSIPLAALGGFAGIQLVHHYHPDQNMDTLTMLGFIILTGTVVNNAILIVHQALNLIRIEKKEIRKSISEAVQTRVRPILMSTTTSVFGMLPLVIFPGEGSELYRGLGSVVIGGLIVSTLMTLVLIPCLFSLVINFQEQTVKFFNKPTT